MKKALFVFMTVVLFGSCPAPVLKWIDTPVERDRFEGNSGDKEIISFTFGLGSNVEHDLPIGGTLDHTGKIPISVILSGENSLNGLVPEIRFIGKALTPPSGTPKDFSASVNSPVVYTVTAEDNSTRDYGVKVYVKNESSREIVRFTVDVRQGLSAEGIINQEAGTISVSVPMETDTRNLTAHVVHTGQTVKDPADRSYMAETFDMSGDFSTPANWIVTAHDGGTKTYTVTVNREQSDAKEITSFGFHLTGEEDIIGGEPQPDGKYPILVVLPRTAYATMDGGSKAPFIDFIGESISPTEESTLTFTNPLSPPTYTVAAENGSTRDYVVSVIPKELPPDNAAEITGFYFTDPLAQGIIDQTAKTITLAVPWGTDLRSLRPDIYFKGASVSPRSGQPQDFTNSDTVPVEYTVRARDGIVSNKYYVSVHPVRATPAVKTGTETADVGVGTDTDGSYICIAAFPTHIENSVININYPGLNETITINPEDVYSEHIVNVTNINEKVVIVNPPANPPAPPAPPLGSDASIDYFCFTNPAAIGAIGAGSGTDPANPIPIAVQVPYGTDRRTLTATIIYTGKGIVGLPGHNPLKDGPRSFQDPVDYVVMAENDTETAQNRKYYRVTVTPGEPDTAKEITAFSFVNVPPAKVLISGVPNGAGKYPIEITVPRGTILTGLSPVITYTGVSIAAAGGSFTAANGPGTVTAAAENFSSPIDYRVTAQNGSTKTYAVTVREDEDEAIEITGFYFTEPLAVGKINQNANMISVTVPSGTSRESLKPTVYFTGMGLNPGSGTANDFTNIAMYTVTGFSGKIRTYSVVVNSVPSSSKDITRFKLSGVANSSLVIGAVPDADGLYPISVQVPAGTNLDNLGTEITYTGASIGPAAETPRNFNSPQNYTITAEDGSVKTYKIIVNAANPDAKMITSLIFNAVPLAGGGTVRVTAAIDQAGRTITARVPQTADISGLRSTITYIGKSITYPGGIKYSNNPFTDTGKNFSGSQTYTVEDQNGDSLSYTVTVIRQDGFTVTFEGEKERTVIASNVFDSNTGIVTVTIDTGAVEGPYAWYIDGVQQGVSDSTFTLNVGNGSLYPGRYEIMAAGMKEGLRYTGKVYFVVAGRS